MGNICISPPHEESWLNFSEDEKNQRLDYVKRLKEEYEAHVNKESDEAMNIKLSMETEIQKLYLLKRLSQKSD